MVDPPPIYYCVNRCVATVFAADARIRWTTELNQRQVDKHVGASPRRLGPHSRMTPKVGGADLRVAPWPRPPRRLIHASHARGASQSVTIAARTKPGNLQWQKKGGSSGEKWDRMTADMGRLGSKVRRIGCGGSRRPRHQRPWTFPLANF